MKLRCYWERSEEQFGNLGNPLRTWKWRVENTLRTRAEPKNSLPPPSLKKKIGLLMRARWAFSLGAWNFYFQNCLSLFLAWANGRGTNCGNELLVYYLKDMQNWGSGKGAFFSNCEEVTDWACDCQSIFQCFLCGEISHTGEVCDMAFLKSDLKTRVAHQLRSTLNRVEGPNSYE